MALAERSGCELIRRAWVPLRGVRIGLAHTVPTEGPIQAVDSRHRFAAVRGQHLTSTGRTPARHPRRPSGPYRDAMDDGPGAGLREARLGEVDGLVSGTRGRPAGGAVPDGGAGSRLSALRTRLRVAHARCDAVDGVSWAGYVVDLDRGIDELHVELAMAAQRPVAGPSLDDVLLARTSALELDAWRLSVDAGPASTGGSDLRPALIAAEVALARYREDLAASRAPARAELEEAMARLRTSETPDGPAD